VECCENSAFAATGGMRSTGRLIGGELSRSSRAGDWYPGRFTSPVVKAPPEQCSKARLGPGRPMEARRRPTQAQFAIGGQAVRLTSRFVSANACLSKDAILAGASNEGVELGIGQ